MRRNLWHLAALTILLGILFSGTVAYAESDEENKITIHMLHYFGGTDTDVSARYLKELIETEFGEAFPNVNLVQEVYDNQTYKSKMKIAMAVDDVPDIMFGYGGGFSETYIKSGRILALDDYLDDFYKENMDMDMQQNFIYDDKLYGICFSYWEGVLYCNKELFRQAGAEIPNTYEELIAVSKKLREAGIEPVACGMLNKWHGQQWINNFTIQLGGLDLYNSMVNGTTGMNNEVLAQAGSLVADLVNEGVFCSDMYRMSSSEAEDMFLNGEAAMIYIGNWYTETAWERLGDKLEAVKMPAVPQALETNDYHGGAVNGWMVSADTKYPELAANIAAWFAYEISCYQPEHAAFTIEEEDIKGEINPIDKKIMNLYSDRGEGGAAWDTIMTTGKSEIWLSVCGQLFEGNMTGEEFAETLGEQLG